MSTSLGLIPAGLAAAMAIGSGCAVGLSVGEATEAAPADRIVVAESMDSCVVRTNMAESDQHEVCYVGSFTSGRLRASGLRPGSKLEIVDSTGQTIILQVPDEAHYASSGAGLDVELGFPQNPNEIVVKGRWSDGEELEFAVQQ